ADYIVFPCEEAEEPYSHFWKEFDEFKQKNKSKFKYIPTGIDQCVATVTSDKVFSKYEIPNNSFVVSFVGRHNEIKGYDNLKVIGKNIISTIANSYFLIAGNENPLHGLDNKRWIEAGWTNDPYSLINASDVFILPNKETYFDLVFLEVLSLGKTIVASKTGGNKYFERFKSSGIYLY
ncbi:glycosyltransferase, partial [Lactobacillus helveticus]|uniref:glycosyltransferase n=1 Tax=Lactobacillus helveticus TaxID=1587 RepID=UPI001561EAB5